MPHVNSGGSSSATTAGAGNGGADDFASNDEVKVYKDEGDEEQRSSENLSEDKLGLVTETEEGKSSDGEGKNSYSADENSNGASIGGVKIPKYPLLDRLPFGYPLIPPYPYPNAPPLVASPGKLFSPHSSLGFYMYNNDHLSQPPPAHMGIQIDPKTGLPRHSLYGLPTSPGQLSHSLYSSDLSQMHSFDVLSRSSPSAPFSSSYPPTLPGSTLAWFGASGILPPHPGFPYPSFNHHHPIVTSSSLKQELSPLSESTENCRDCRPMPRCKINGLSSSQGHHRGVLGHSSGSLMGGGGGGGGGDLVQEKKRPYVKKPLNAYMLFMKEMRQTVIEECTLKESAAINQILGRKWHALDKSEQQKYYDMARKEKELHLQLYPGWSARDNYATHTKKKKRKRESSNIDNCNRRQIDSDDAMAACPNNRKCRARFGLDQQHQWCKACRNKKRCIWLRGDTTEDEDDFADYDNQTTVGDVDTSESVMVDGKLFKMSPGKAFLSIPDVDRLQINSVNSFLVNRNQGRI